MTHTLYGDGREETDALQALIDGEPVFYPDGERAVWGKLRTGLYGVGRTLKLRRGWTEPASFGPL